MKINQKKAGMTFGALAGLVHVVWSLFVLFGWGQGLINFIFKLHMITPPFTVGPFDFGTAALLVIVTAIIGYIVGTVFAILWNRVHQ